MAEFGRRLAVDVAAIERANKETIRTAFDAQGQEQAGIFDLLAADVRWTIVGNCVVSGTYLSKQQFLDRALVPFNARMSSPTVRTIRGLYADGDTVIVYFDGVSTAKDGQPYENSYTWYLRMNDGRIVDVVAFFDSIAFNDLWTRVSPD
jgi:ketosteroid isomerase-like protein